VNKLEVYGKPREELQKMTSFGVQTYNNFVVFSNEEL